MLGSVGEELALAICHNVQAKLTKSMSRQFPAQLKETFVVMQGHTLKMIAFLPLLLSNALMLTLLEFYKAELSIPCTLQRFRLKQLLYEVNRKVRL